MCLVTLVQFDISAYLFKIHCNSIIPSMARPPMSQKLHVFVFRCVLHFCTISLVSSLGSWVRIKLVINFDTL